VWQAGLMYKLKERNLRPSLWKIVADSFCDFKCCVSINGIQSEWFQIRQGVHQGGPLSSLLFQIHLDAMLIEIQNSRCGVKVYDIEIACPTFADDMSLITLSENSLQKMINIANKYRCKWRFRFNVPKCVVMAFGNSSFTKDIFLGEEVIKLVKDFIHLGTMLYSSPKIEKEAINNRISDAQGRVWMLLSLGSKNVHINPLTFSKGYWSIVVTKECYGLFLTLITDSSLRELDKAHAKLAKRVQGLPPNTTVSIPLASLKWLRLSSYIAKEGLQFLWQLMILPMESVYKQLVINRIVDLKESKCNRHQTGPTAAMIHFSNVYGLLPCIEETMESGRVMTKLEWKSKVKKQVFEKESKEWTATSFLHKSLRML
jgi:hypothetical protein